LLTGEQFIHKVIIASLEIVGFGHGEAKVRKEFGVLLGMKAVFWLADNENGKAAYWISEDAHGNSVSAHEDSFPAD
jgi:hypothetical protein